MSDYNSDILSWSERQAELLRRHVAGDRINSADLDWPNIIEEVADVGRNTLRACRSHLLQALLHDLKAKAWPLSRDVPRWRSEARVAQHQCRRRLCALDAPVDRPDGPLLQGGARHAGVGGRAATCVGGDGVSSDIGRVAERRLRPAGGGPVHRGRVDHGSDHPLLRQPLDVGMRHAQQFGQQPGIVLAVAGRAAIDRAADIGRRAGQFHRQLIDRPGADLGAGDFGQPFQMAQLRIVVAAVFGVLADARPERRHSAAPS